MQDFAALQGFFVVFFFFPKALQRPVSLLESQELTIALCIDINYFQMLIY